MTTTATEIEAWTERARSLGPLVEQYRDAAEAARHMPLPLADAMRERGLFALWQPASLGGTEMSIEGVVRVMEELGRLDGSVSWNSMISTNHSVLWSLLEPSVAAEMLEGGRNVIAGTIAGGGTVEAPGGGEAIPVPGGFKLSGRWAFASGSHHADWMIGNGRILENGDFRRGPQGNVALFSFLMPPSEVTILDNWYTTGMRGTGSHDIEATDVFVPAERVFPTLGAKPHHASPLYRSMISTPWCASIAGVALGIGRDAIDTFLEIGRTKGANMMSRVSLADRETAHKTVGECEGRLRAARSFLLESSRAIDHYITHGEDIPNDAAAVQRCAAANASLASADVTIAMFRLAGSTSFYADSRLDRCFRDVNTLTQHAVGGLAGATVAGRYWMGGPLTPI
ncbi:MAG TPA: acyl-CoA dehydrogenase family protein [Dehalococcoidia bacterium]|nr:acyl-CoA dehydrogenase family protein [Dehalococcoidia bacterium]